MSRPQVSILMPVYNEALFLQSTLASLQNQTLRQWELVVVDDGSNDGTKRLLGQAASADPRIRPFFLPRSGIVAALKYGLENCQSDFVARLDGDDICHPKRLEKQLDALKRDSQLDLVACRIEHFPRSDMQPGMKAYETWQNELLSHDQIMRDRFVESPFAHPSVMFRKSAVERVGGYRDQPWAEDYDLWLRMADAGFRFQGLAETLLYWRDRPQRLTRTATNCSLDAFRRCRLHYLERDFLSNRKTVTLWGAGQEGKKWQTLLRESGFEISCWVEVDRRKIGQRICNAPVIGRSELTASHAPILVTIGSRGARGEVRDVATVQRLSEGEDYVCVT